MSKLKIGILKCDSPEPEHMYIAGSYVDMFDTLLRGANPEIETVGYDVENGDYPSSLTDCSGYVCTGSYRSVYENEPWIKKLSEFACELYSANIRMAGICFGHQLIAHALPGGEVRKADYGWGVGAHRAEIKNPQPWMVPESGTYNLLYSHQDQVMALPDGCITVASAEHCPNAMILAGNKFLGIQGHPEFIPAYSEAILGWFGDKIPANVATEARKTFTQALANEIVGKWIAEFLAS